MGPFQLSQASGIIIASLFLDLELKNNVRLFLRNDVLLRNTVS